MIKRIQKNDTRAFELLIDIYSHYVGAVIRSVIGQTMTNEDIEEVAADVFVEIWEQTRQAL